MQGSYGKARRRLHRGARVATNRSTWPRRPTEPFDANVEEVGGSLHLRIPRVSGAPVALRDYQAIALGLAGRLGAAGATAGPERGGQN